MTPTTLHPLLLQLAAEGATDAQLTDEGFNRWEIAAARAIVNRARTSSTRRAGATTPKATAQPAAGRY